MKTASGEIYDVEKYRLHIEIEFVALERDIPGGSITEIDPRGKSIEVILLPDDYKPDNHSIILGMDFISEFHVEIFQGQYTIRK